MNNLKSKIILLFVLLFGMSLNAQIVNHDDILKPLDLPKGLKVDTIYMSKKQDVIKNEEIKSRTPFFMRYIYKGYKGTLKFFIYDDELYEIQQYEYLWIKCLENQDSIDFNLELDFIKKEIQSNSTGVKKIRFYKDLTGNWLSNKTNKHASRLSYEQKGVYNDILIGEKNIPFHFHLGLYIYDLPMLQQIRFDTIYNNIPSFMNFYESKKDNIWLLFKFEHRDTGRVSQNRMVLINPVTLKIVSDNYSIIHNALLE
jgi:hypothetical protein